MEDCYITKILRQMEEVLERKRHDYADDNNRYSNFEFTGRILDEAVEAGVRGANLSFLSLLTTKLARIIELVGHNKKAENEALEDSLMDGANYLILWSGWLHEREE